MKLPVLPLAILALVGFAPPCLAEAPPQPVANTTSGLARGVELGTYRTFLGLPYAAAPTGRLRWEAPRPAPRWQGVRDATKPGADCAQPTTPGIFNPNKRYDEDCLYLNITTPRDGAAKPYPVMVWIHGGGFQNGAGVDYDATRMATQGDVMVVTINYRLSIFGFFGLPGLRHSGDLGLLDQQAALRWVRANAAAFGGDPHNVTVFGESAGAMSGCAQLTAPSAKGLFDKVILESGSCLQAWRKGMYYPTLGPFYEFVPVSDIEKHGLEAAASRVAAKAHRASLAVEHVPKHPACRRRLAVRGAPAIDHEIEPLAIMV